MYFGTFMVEGKSILSMLKKLFTLHLFVISLSCISQDGGQTLSIQVIDSLDQSGIGYVSVGLKGSRIGTATDFSGRFELRIQDKYLNDTLQIQHINYTLREIPIREILNDSVIYLTAKSEILDTVDIRPLSAKEFVMAAYDYAPENYHIQSIPHLASLKERIAINDVLYYELDAELEVHKRNYLDTLKPEVYLTKAFLNYNNDTSISSVLKEENIDVSAINLSGPAASFNLEPVASVIDSIFTKSDISEMLYFYSEDAGNDSTVLIDFKSDGKVHYTRLEGNLAFDKRSKALKVMEMRGRVVVPLFIRSLLLLAGLRVKDNMTVMNANYAKVEDLYQLQSLNLRVEVLFIKIRLFRENIPIKMNISQEYEMINAIEPNKEGKLKVDFRKSFITQVKAFINSKS